VSRHDGHTTNAAAAAWPARDRVVACLQEHAGRVITKDRVRKLSHVTESEFQNALASLSYSDQRLCEDDRGHLFYLAEDRGDLHSSSGI
jgi:hypothetical protein